MGIKRELKDSNGEWLPSHHDNCWKVMSHHYCALRVIERLQSELSWIYGNCELRDHDNTHVDSNDVKAAVAAEAAGGES